MQVSKRNKGSSFWTKSEESRTLFLCARRLFSKWTKTHSSSNGWAGPLTKGICWFCWNCRTGTSSEGSVRSPLLMVPMRRGGDSWWASQTWKRITSKTIVWGKWSKMIPIISFLEMMNLWSKQMKEIWDTKFCLEDNIFFSTPLAKSYLILLEMINRMESLSAYNSINFSSID